MNPARVELRLDVVLPLHPEAIMLMDRSNHRDGCKVWPPEQEQPSLADPGGAQYALGLALLLLPVAVSLDRRNLLWRPDMKAIVLNEYSDSNHLKLTEIPVPKSGIGEIQVNVEAAGIDPIDWKLRSGDYRAFKV
jgi:hypothetical protein